MDKKGWLFTQEKGDKDAPGGVIRTTFHEDGRKVVGFAFDGVRLRDGDWIVDGKITGKPPMPEDKPSTKPIFKKVTFAKKGK